MVGIIVVSNYVELGENYINYATQVVLLAFIFSSTSITLWTFIGKFMRKFATNDKFIKYFNYVMSGASFIKHNYILYITYETRIKKLL